METSKKCKPLPQSGAPFPLQGDLPPKQKGLVCQPRGAPRGRSEPELGSQSLSAPSPPAHPRRMPSAAPPFPSSGAAGQNKQHSITKNTAKLDRETEELHHDRVPLEVGKVIQQGRQSKGLTQKDLATVGVIQTQN